ncbi:LuxR C-terminal-related transcriptional regulator [Amycolatopsis sp. NPDC003861]
METPHPDCSIHTADVPPLPAPGAFIGREPLLASVLERVSEARPLTLTGPAGIGKTRLALEVATEIAAGFADGAEVVDLTPHTDPALLVPAVSGVLGVHYRTEQSGMNALLESVRPRELLLVLDNCEQLIDDVADMVAQLLAAAPLLRVLATSREPLMLESEQVIVVPPLSVPPASSEWSTSDVLVGAMPYDAVQLLATRAAAAGVPGFAASADGALVAQLVRRLDGIPLAIELAAAGLYTRSVADMVAQLDDQLGLLVNGRRDTPQHHQSLHAAIQWSHRTCSSGQRTLWARLSVFSASFDIDDVQAVCADSTDDTPGTTVDGEPVTQLLDALARKSIVSVERDTGGSVRYRLLEAIRQFGQEELAGLDSAEPDRWRIRHAGYCRHLAVEAASAYFSARDVEMIGRVRKAMPDIRSALDWCLSQPAHHEMALQLAVALGEARIWFHIATTEEGRRWLHAAIKAAGGQAPSTLVLRGRALLAWLAMQQADPQAGLLVDACREQAFRAARSAPPFPADAIAHLIAGMHLMFARNDREAITGLTAAYTSFRTASNRSYAHLAIQYAAIAAFLVGDSAIDQLSAQCFDDAEADHTTLALSGAHWIRGLTMWDKGNIDDAADHFSKFLRLNHESGSHTGIRWGIDAMGWVAAADGDWERAIQLLNSALHLRTTASEPSNRNRLHDTSTEANRNARQNVSRLAYNKAREAGAKLTYEQAVALALKTRTSPPEQRPAPAKLTVRQRQVAELIALGKSNQAIADQLFVALKTVESHVKAIMERLGVQNRTQIATWLTRNR